MSKIKKVLHDAAERNEVELLEIDVDENGDLAAQFKVNAMPTLVFLKDGVELEKFRTIGADQNKIIENVNIFGELSKKLEVSQISDLPMEESASVKCQSKKPTNVKK